MLKLFNLKFLRKIPGITKLVSLRFSDSKPQKHIHLFNLDFCGQMGAGPGVDKDGTLFNLLQEYGLSFVEIGPVNGTNVISIIDNIRKARNHNIISMCIRRDHLRAFSLAYDFVDMFDIEVPYQNATEVLGEILETRLTYDSYKPVLLRLVGEIRDEDISEILDYCLFNGVDGIVAATEDRVRKIVQYTSNKLPIIGFGGIRSPEAAESMLKAGATLIQITTALILDGPSTIRKINRHLNSL